MFVALHNPSVPKTDTWAGCVAMSSLGRSIVGLLAALALGTGHTAALAMSVHAIDAPSAELTEPRMQDTHVWINKRVQEFVFDIRDELDFNHGGYTAELSDPVLAGEPGTLVLLGLGLVALALIRRRRSRK